MHSATSPKHTMQTASIVMVRYFFVRLFSFYCHFVAFLSEMFVIVNNDGVTSMTTITTWFNWCFGRQHAS